MSLNKKYVNPIIQIRDTLKKFVFPPKQVLISNRCDTRYNLIGVYSDGRNGSYEQLIEINSVKCGFKVF